MSRSTLICSIIAELLFATAAVAGPPPDAYERCMANCAQLSKQSDKICKEKMGGKCDGRAKTALDGVKKQCADDCAKRKK